MAQAKPTKPAAVSAKPRKPSSRKPSSQRSRSTQAKKTKPGTTVTATPTTAALPPAPAITTPLSPAGKLSALDAAAKVLVEAQQALTCQEMIEAMAAKGYWTSPHGRTPAATLYASILREIQRQGRQACFIKTERGKFIAK